MSAGSSRSAAGSHGKFTSGNAPKGKPFVKGISGNPKGTSWRIAEVKALALSHSAEAVERLVTHMRSKNPKISLAACVALLDRGLGRPVQEIASNGPLINISMPNGGTITNAADAASAYALLMGNPHADIDALTFILPEQPARVAEPVELTTLPAITRDVADTSDAVITRRSTVEVVEPEAIDPALAVWARLSE
jgi:hypothetical protein